ncbi:hypothetical protein SLEP1_g59561 [Rubroshorea leprosula]|uniref:Uncharacterized protein n=1 Tax=Rubroshorea leprosula TaxID=152421 RepID=A0AAV5MWA5_9ROSI|nr:hypothetical protein SLEP1_g59561 [Rubroshorea leprosula]
MVSEPRTREQWDSSLFGCLYEFCGSDSEILKYGISSEILREMD